jgi:hypothetical protein
MIRVLSAGILLLGLGALPAGAASVTVTIDANADRHPISPLIYGMNFASTADLKALNAPFNRWGGNSTGTYNWRQNAWNLALDWYFESYPQPGAAESGEADAFVSDTLAAGSEAMLTLPILGWVAKLAANRKLLPSFAVDKYGPQQAVDPFHPNAGNGVRPNGTRITGNDPNDAYVPDNAATERGWLEHLVATFGKSTRGGVRYYVTGNETSIAWETHRDIRPVGVRAAEFRDTVLAYSEMVKSVDAKAQVVAPEEWGWLGFLYSGFDQQNEGGAMVDRNEVMGGRDYLPWLLSEWKKQGRPVDVVSIHYYPQSGEFSEDVSPAKQLLRNRSTRELWDPRYVSESWIRDTAYGGKPNFIPRLKEAVRKNYYADTPIALTEYNWGAEKHINGATAQADLLGIFGREGLGIATRWGTPKSDSPVYKVFQLYRNYDGRKSTFGDTSVSARAPDPDQLSAFGAMRGKDGALTVMLVNKALGESNDVLLRLSGVPASGKAQPYQLTSANVIEKLPREAYRGGKLRITVPAQSVTLLVLPGA